MIRMESNNSVRAMILRDLGYCCLQEFFIRYTDNKMIAAKLGVGVRAVRDLRKRVAKGEGHCSKNQRCIRLEKI
jgi:hypothetical protein